MGYINSCDQKVSSSQLFKSSVHYRLAKLDSNGHVGKKEERGVIGCHVKISYKIASECTI